MSLEHPLIQWLEQTTVESIAPQLSDFVLLQSEMTIYEALQKLAKEKVSSAPVLDSNGVAVGMCSLLDIVVFVIQHFEQEEVEESAFELLARGSHVSRKLLSDLLSVQTPIDSYTVIKEGSTLKTVLNHFASGIHRCPIMSADNSKLKTMLTQSAIVKALVLQKGLLGELGDTPIRDLAIGSAPVISADMGQTAMDVFQLMAENGLSGIAIVDHAGALLGNISAKDLSVCEQNKIYSAMRQNARVFIQKIRSNSINISNPAIAVSEDSTLNTALLKLSANGIHRIYVCNKDQHPIRVISLRDVVDFVHDMVEESENA